ncbi:MULTISPECIES: hypothetical protein [Nocardia]|uniref:hypothetical protein n=1 Tax=Nocardia TaxID=1817 RepID=UPI001E37A881|nr:MULTISPECIES: hypothetical protein [Nocardia]
MSVAIDSFPEVFAAGLAPEKARVPAVSQRPLSAIAFSEPATTAAWKTTPGRGIVPSADRTLDPEGSSGSDTSARCDRS